MVSDVYVSFPLYGYGYWKSYRPVAISKYHAHTHNGRLFPDRYVTRCQRQPECGIKWQTPAPEQNDSVNYDDRISALYVWERFKYDNTTYSYITVSLLENNLTQYNVHECT